MLAPIIVLGLGGVGSEVVARLERKVNKMQIKSKALFAVLDTDINTLNKIEQEGFGGCVIQISKNMTVKDYLLQSGEYEKWFKSTEGLNMKSMTEGAGQVRAISRLAFDVAVRNGTLKGLEERITQLFQVSDSEEEHTPRVFIVSSVAGGTGSGSLIPMALYIRRFFEESLHNSTVIIKGMLIMPDVFWNVIQNDFERVSMEANAYAVIKELEAFIRKEEGYLPENYSKKLRILLPVSTTDKGEEYNRLCYNYCYLFGGKRQTGTGLRNFQEYLNHVAECIYAQAFSPMQKLNNSIEDNVFRIAMTSICEYGKEGFRRFCGAGTAVLEYPYEQILEMLALRKTGMLLSEQWRQIDKEYSKECKKWEEQRIKGKYSPIQKRSEFYVEYVEAQKKGNAFAAQIYNENLIEQNSGNPQKSWDIYWENIQQAVKEWLEEDNTLGESKKTLLDLISTSRNNIYHQGKEEVNILISRYEKLVSSSKEELDKKRSIVDVKFFGTREEDTEDKFYFETWVKKDGKFIHPNSMRFFLYKILALFEKEKEKILQESENVSKDLERSMERLHERAGLSSKGWVNNLFRRMEIREIYNRVELGIQALEKYQNLTLLDEIISQGTIFFQKLSNAYEAFYSAFEYNVNQYYEKAEDLEQQLQDVDGTVRRYVCCDKQSIRQMENITIDVQNNVGIDGEISELIYHTIRDKINSGNEMEKYGEVFQNILVNHWKKDLKENYQHILDKDILDALDREALYVTGKGGDRIYIGKRLKDMWNIANPFLSLVNDGVGISKRFCAYSALLEENMEYPREHYIQMLRDSGGATDKEGAINRYTIIFYQVNYALAPEELKELNITWDDKKEDYIMGSISKSYYKMFGNSKYSRMTSHIDWNWNRFDILPDFNKEYQMYLENLTYQMFFYKCIGCLNIVMNENGDIEEYRMSYRDTVEQYTTLHKLLIEGFVKNLSQVMRMNDELKTEIQKCIAEGRPGEEILQLNVPKGWDIYLNGIFEFIQMVNIDGGIREYDASVTKKMVFALVDLLWRVCIQFESVDVTKFFIRNYFEEQKERYMNIRKKQEYRTSKYKKSKYYPAIESDILSALKEKLREIERKK